MFVGLAYILVCRTGSPEYTGPVVVMYVGLVVIYVGLVVLNI